MKWISAVVTTLLLMLAAGCARSGESGPVKRYELRGEVIRLDPQAKTATIKHEKIGDWMDAMTMEFPVKDAAEFAKLKAGDRIKATVFVKGMDYWIGEVQPGPPAG